MIWLLPAFAQEPIEPDEPEAEPELEEPAAEEPEIFTIDPIDVPLPSATRRLSELEGSDVTLADLGLDEDLYERAALIRGAWFLRPQIVYQRLVRDEGGGGALRLGAWAGRRWWTLEALPIQLAADLGIRATAPVGQGVGHRVEALGHVGPWLGPARIELGFVLRWEQEKWRGRTVVLANALHLGPELGVGFDLEVVRLHGSVTPVWKLAGDRGSAKDGDPVFPRLGHETTWSAGVGVPIDVVTIALDASWRDTAVGGFLEAGMSIQLVLGGS